MKVMAQMAMVMNLDKCLGCHTCSVTCKQAWTNRSGTEYVNVILLRDPASTKAYDIALVTTDITAPAEQIIARYADRWSIEQAIKDGKDLLGAGDAQNRLQFAVERTLPFAMLTLTILTCWYHQSGHTADDLAARLSAAPWYRHKQHIAVTDMLIAFRRTRITAITAGQDTHHLNDHDAQPGQSAAA